ncbi:MAG: serpin family protein [Bacteroidales bacterium]|jgi:serpin B|nr:serpin family protein [Bacteroidales bacterium]
MKTLITALSLIFLFQYTFAQEETSIIESNNRFSFDIYQKLKKHDKNIIFSPASITSAIAMTYIGAKNNTFSEIGKTFYFNSDINTFSNDYKNLIIFKENDKSKLSLYNANSLWIQNELLINKDFLNFNKKYFLSSLHFTDFINDSDQSRLKINKWVEDNTNNKIKDLLQPNTIDHTTRLVLVNALYFKGAWLNKFREEDNTSENFQIDKKEFVKAVFMNAYINSWYYEDKYAQIIDIPYSDENISLMIILPKSYKKLMKIEKKLNYEYYNSYIQNKEKRRIFLSLPKFKVESEFNLNKTLNDLGIKDAFTSAADFTGITKAEKLYISQVVHKANITVDEEGTEASASTAVIMRKTLVLLENVDFKVNKPFIFVLRNNENNCIYFIGKILLTN